MRNILKILLVCVGIIALGAILYLIHPIVVEIYASLQNYRRNVASRADYTEVTTPLQRSVVDDICSSFKLNPNDARCTPTSVVYGPDFFSDIVAYFGKLPHEDATLQTVDDKLGPYLDSCDDPDNEGYYRCWYDLRGDGIYPISVYFTKGGFIYRVIANTSGS